MPTRSISTTAVHGHATSSSLSNPCPPNTGIGYTTFNDTIFVICDSAFAKNTSAENLALALGLGLGIGIPILLIVMVYLIIRYCKKPITIGSMRDDYSTPRSVIPIEIPSKTVEKTLSESGLGDFRFGNLTENLKNEIMTIRLREGRNLTQFVKFAEELNYPEMANWIENLNPGAFPPEIHQKIIAPTNTKIYMD